MLVGAGTVINKEQLERAEKAGAKFIVTPGLSGELVDLCKEKNLPVFPGVVTPSEIMEGLARGVEIFKFFPASVFGSLKAIKALGGPFPQLKFMPTGGVNPENLPEYLESDKIFACGGSWMVKASFIDNEEYAKITELSREAKRSSNGFAARTEQSTSLGAPFIEGEAVLYTATARELKTQQEVTPQ